MLLDNERIARLVRENLTKLPFTAEEVKTLIPRLTPYYRGLIGQEDTLELEESVFNYKRRIEEICNFDVMEKIYYPFLYHVNSGGNLTKEQKNILDGVTSYHNEFFQISTYSTEKEYSRLVLKEPRLLTTKTDTIGRNFATPLAYFLRQGPTKILEEEYAAGFMKNPALFLQHRRISIRNIEEAQEYLHYEYVSNAETEYINVLEEAYNRYFKDDIERLDCDIFPSSFNVNCGLLYQDPEITIHNIKRVEEYYAYAGLQRASFLMAANLCTELYLQPAQDTINWVNTTVRELAGPQATVKQKRHFLKEYLQCSVQIPNIFFIPSQENLNHLKDICELAGPNADVEEKLAALKVYVELVKSDKKLKSLSVQQFEKICQLAGVNASTEERLTTLKVYADLAKSNEDLKSLSSEAFQRFAVLYKAYAQGHLSVATKTRDNSPDSFIKFMKLKGPYKRSIEDLEFRVFVSEMGFEDIKDSQKFLHISREKLEKACFAALGHPDPSIPVPQKHTLEPTPEMWRKYVRIADIVNRPALPPAQETIPLSEELEIDTEQEQADNLLLRSLIRAGVLKGKLDER